MEPRGALEQGRRSYASSSWSEAYDLLTKADNDDPLAAADLELLARSAYMLGRDDEYVHALERACREFEAAGELPRAARSTFWIGHSFLFRGDAARATGWFARGQRLLGQHGEDCVEHGWLLIPVWLQQMATGDYETAHATTLAAEQIGEHFGDRDLTWLARDEQARGLIGLGRDSEAMRLVDETFVAAASGELSPIVTGIVYCNTIIFCRDALELGRVGQWTDALTEWCDRQSQMIAHNGLCLVHRAEMSMLHGHVQRALDEAQRAVERFSAGVLNQIACGKAFYCSGEVHRLLGELDAAAEAYQHARERGYEPQPGLSLLRLLQGDAGAAAAAIRRVAVETIDPVRRVGVLPAYVEIMLADGEVGHARAACHELVEIAAVLGNDFVTAMALYCRAAVALVGGDPRAALVDLRQSLALWTTLEVPYEATRVRELVAVACRALGDEDTAQLELATARSLFDELGATLDRVRIDTLITPSERDDTHGLTRRELEVLRLVAAGKTNRDIAETLVISEHTVARHVQNIFAKLGVSSRTAASAYAFGHDLV